MTMARNTPPPTRIPRTESSQKTRWVARLATRPARMPGRLMTSGMMRWRRSMPVMATSAAGGGGGGGGGGRAARDDEVHGGPQLEPREQEHRRGDDLDERVLPGDRHR